MLYLPQTKNKEESCASRTSHKWLRTIRRFESFRERWQVLTYLTRPLPSIKHIRDYD